MRQIFGVIRRSSNTTWWSASCQNISRMTFSLLKGVNWRDWNASAGLTGAASAAGCTFLYMWHLQRENNISDYHQNHLKRLHTWLLRATGCIQFLSWTSRRWFDRQLWGEVLKVYFKDEMDKNPKNIIEEISLWVGVISDSPFLRMSFFDVAQRRKCPSRWDFFQVTNRLNMKEKQGCP